MRGAGVKFYHRSFGFRLWGGLFGRLIARVEERGGREMIAAWQCRKRLKALRARIERRGEAIAEHV